MLQRSSLPSTSTAEIADSLQRSLNGRAWDSVRWRALRDLLPLPSTWQQYLLACLALWVVLGGMLLHVLLSVQIARADFQLRQMREEYARIERRNGELVYQITQRASLAHMAELARRQGYVPATGRTYVVRSRTAFADPVRGDLDPQAAVPELPPEQAVASMEEASSSARSSARPNGWLAQAERWWQETQHAVGAATVQLWRDITGWTE
jgi:hypothetical protein